MSGDIINSIDRFRKGWTGGLPETPCGAGATMRETKEQREWIPEIIERYQIKTIADIGAGDLNWIKNTNLPEDVEYTAYDLIIRHPEVKQFDLIKSIPQKVDMIMCLWVLNHLPYEHCRQAIANIKASGSRYLLMTDRKRYHNAQPPEIHMESIEEMPISPREDTIKLIDLIQINA